MLTSKPIVNIEYHSSGRPKHHFVCTPKIESLSTNEGFKEEKFVTNAMMGYWPQVPVKKVLCFNVFFDLNVKSPPYPKAIYQNIPKVSFSEIKRSDFHQFLSNLQHYTVYTLAALAWVPRNP